MQARAFCSSCKQDVPINGLEVLKDNEYRGRCSACGAKMRGFLIAVPESSSQ